MGDLRILPMTSAHWEEVRSIYQSGMDTGIATFETSVPDQNTWFEDHLETGRLVAVKDNKVVGWIALSPVSRREVYKGVAEVSVYVHPDALRTGVGNALMQELIRESEAHGFWTLQSAVFPDNTPSIRLHLRNGFRVLGVRERIAMRGGVWYDSVLMERRSPKF